MSKIKLPLDHSKQAPKNSASAGRLKLARLLSVGGIGLLLAVLLAATIATGFPRHALAAGGVTITDVITFPDSVPSNVTANQDQIVIGSDTGTYIGSGMSSSVTKNGNTATFTINIGSVANSSNPSKSITPIPAGNYSVSSFGSSGTGTVVVAADGSGKTTISGGSSCGDSICSLSAAATSTQQLATACGASDCSNVGDSLAGLTQGSAPGSDHSNNVTCDTGGFGINWILCPVFNTVAGVSGWLFSNIVQPFLRTTPISTDSSDKTYMIWSSFRVYGDVFLVIALLVVVFGQSLGGGLIDAYTAKKVLPRLLAAAILINLSIYIVAALVDITNILGGGIGSIITAPLKGAGAFNISPSGVQGGEILGLSGTALISGLSVGVLGLVAGISALANLATFIALFVIMPVVFGLLAAFLTLVVRKAAILALIIVSPVAFALYCLPNTEQYFKKWWELLIQTLAVYPIVIMFFAVADVLSVTIMDANSSSNPIAPIISFVLQFLPLIFIPYAFRLAGGAIGRLHEVLTTGHKRMQEGIKGNPNDPWSFRNRAKRGVNNSMLMGREKLINSANTRQKNGGRYGLLARSAGIMFPNDVQRSKMNKESAEMSQGLVGTGDDWRYRAGFASQIKYRRDDGTEAVGWFGTNARVDENGYWLKGTGTQYSDHQVKESRAFIGSDPSHYQAGLSYELNNKAGDKEDVVRVLDAHDRNMAEMHVGEQEAPMWVGTVFSGQNKYKDLKHTRTRVLPDGTKVYERNSREHTREQAQSISNYAFSNMSEHTIDAETDDYLNAKSYLALNDSGRYQTIFGHSPTEEDRQSAREIQSQLGQRKIKIRELRDGAEAAEVVNNVQLTANSLNARMQGRGTYALEGEDEHMVQGSQMGAPGAVQKSIDNLVRTAATNNTPPQPRREPPQMPGQGRMF